MADVDAGRILAKLTYMDAQLAVLRPVAEHPTDAPSGPLTVAGVRYAIQTSVEAVIDICFHVSAKAARHVPQGAHDALNAAVAGTGVADAQVQRWHDMIGLRNRLVHGYEQVDDQQLLADLPGGIADLAAFMTWSQRWLHDKEDG
jgi:uncharacterized protein YutE (UPF0331/DUF86 family)